MKTAVIVTKCFEDYQIISWHLMNLDISELFIAKKDHVYNLINKYSKENQNLPLKVLNLERTEYTLNNFTLLDYCERLVVFWNGKNAFIAELIQQARIIGKEVSVVYSYPTSTLKFANTHP